MNIRKPIDYSAMYAALDALMAAGLPQMELYCGIGKAICERPEKGAAVAAAEYLQSAYPNASGFSPRGTRRMREFYRTYENSPALLDEAMGIGWTQNVVILEAELTLEEKAWYIRAVKRFDWTKLELTARTARRMIPGDYGGYDLLIGMDGENLRNMRRICGGDPEGKLHLLLEYTDHPGEVADPWYTRDFQATWRDVNDGCRGLLDRLVKDL